MIEIDEDGDFCTHIDGSDTTQNRAKIKLVSFLTMGRGSMINQWKKLGILTTSSTETDIFSTGKSFPKCAWFLYFRMAQVDITKDDMLMQDDQSSISMHKSQPCSASEGTKHAPVGFFCSR